MFKRKLVEVKDNRFLTMLEEFLPQSQKLLTPKELYTLRYNFGNSKVNIRNPFIIEQIKMNDIHLYKDYFIITSKNGYSASCSKLSDVKDLLGILNQRIIFISRNEESEIISIKIYCPSTDDTMLYIDNTMLDDEHLYSNIFENDYIEFYVVNSEKVDELKGLSKETFAFTKQNILNSSIVIHYVP